MSLVLLLSLAAFGITVDRWQQQVMDEVARTASEVGRATLRTFELPAARRHTPAEPGEGSARSEVSAVFVWHGEVTPTGRAESFLRKREAEPAEGEDTPAPGSFLRTVRMECRTDEAGEQRCTTTTSGTDPEDVPEPFLILADRVQAETDPADGLVLRIPRLTAGAPRGARSSGAGGADAPHDVAVPATTVWTEDEEIRLPIPVAEYRSLFDAMGRRSLALAAGVFAIGTVLSAGLAARFTRPVRRLDAAIRRLGAGDLDVRVDDRGSDEVARLGRAFNDMARSLRASRQRARDMVRRERHAALGRLAAGVAHDVRNPLHSIGLTLQHLSDACRPEAADRAAEFDQAVDVMRGEIRRLDRLVGSFLQFARGETRERSPVDLGALLDDTAGVVRKEAEWRGVELEVDAGPAEVVVRADAEALRSSLLNLVLNSFEAMPDGGRLALRLAAGPAEATIEVADTGIGIAEADRERVFDFAFTTREGGTGLGLAMVYQCVVEDHGGRIDLDSAPGRGTRVRLVLPRPGAGGEVS